MGKYLRPNVGRAGGLSSNANDKVKLTESSQLLCLQEKSTADKLDMLYRKTHFPLALNVAKTQNLDESSVADIHRQYGDHLYLKGDYDGAMQQFVQTIGHLQPSYVIRKVCIFHPPGSITRV